MTNSGGMAGGLASLKGLTSSSRFRGVVPISSRMAPVMQFQQNVAAVVDDFEKCDVDIFVVIKGVPGAVIQLPGAIFRRRPPDRADLLTGDEHLIEWAVRPSGFRRVMQDRHEEVRLKLRLIAVMDELDPNLAHVRVAVAMGDQRLPILILGIGVAATVLRLPRGEGPADAVVQVIV